MRWSTLVSGFAFDSRCAWNVTVTDREGVIHDEIVSPFREHEWEISCEWRLKADHGKVIMIQFEKFNFGRPMSLMVSLMCWSTTKLPVRPAKTQISLCIHPV